MKLWGGRFSKATHPEVERFTHSLSTDRRLARHDLLGSIAHARMLGKTGILRPTEAKRLAQGLKGLLSSLEKNRLRLDSAAEDIHTALQSALQKKVGSLAQKLHAGRSRNDQVVTSLRLWTMEQLDALDQALAQLQRNILHQAQQAGLQVMPGYTHLRHAQPVLVGHLLLSYLSPLQRDRGRLRDARARMDELPLGSGALTGTGLAIDRPLVAKMLGFSRVSRNSIDAVTSRDFVVEVLSGLALLGIHLARIAEDLLLWSTPEFGFLRFDEVMLTGSSMMPQKQNPDFLELIRANAAPLNGALTAALTLLKGLPSGYQRDLQVDKELLFDAMDRSRRVLAVLTHGIQALHWDPQGLQRALGDQALYATDLAEYLVSQQVPFAQAHRAVGQLLAYAEKNRRRLSELPLATFRRFSTRFGKEVYRLLDPRVSIRRKRSPGSTHPAQLAQSIRYWKKQLITKG